MWSPKVSDEEHDFWALPDVLNGWLYSKVLAGELGPDAFKVASVDLLLQLS